MNTRGLLLSSAIDIAFTKDLPRVFPHRNDGHPFLLESATYCRIVCKSCSLKMIKCWTDGSCGLGNCYRHMAAQIAIGEDVALLSLQWHQKATTVSKVHYRRRYHERVSTPVVLTVAETRRRWRRRRQRHSLIRPLFSSSFLLVYVPPHVREDEECKQRK